jgi:hypothetical protein
VCLFLLNFNQFILKQILKEYRYISENYQCCQPYWYNTGWSDWLLLNTKSAFFPVISLWEEISFWLDDNDVCFVWDQHEKLNFHSAGDIAKMYIFYHLIGVIVNMLVLSVVDCGHIKPNHKIYICCFSAKQAELRSKSKVWLAWHHDNVSNLVFNICR